MGMNQSEAENILAVQMDYYGMVYLREYRFAPPRKWRADFMLQHNNKRVLVEVEGGRHVYGRHNRPTGFAADTEKYNAAAAAGWVVLRFVPERVGDWSAVAEIRRVLGMGNGPENETIRWTG